MELPPDGGRADASSPLTSGARPDPLPTYQELLDEALVLTFPASDPISPGAARRADRPVSTPRDETDWSLASGCAEASVAHDAGPPGADDEQPSNYPPAR